MVESVNKIKAYRDGQEREFTERVWAAMGIGHCGWTAVPDVPKEVVQAVWVESIGTLTGRNTLSDGDGSESIKPRKTRQRK